MLSMWDAEKLTGHYCNLEYSVLACFKMGMSGSAPFQRARKSWYAALAFCRPSMAYEQASWQASQCADA